MTETQQVELLRPQKFLHRKGLILLIALLGMVGPLTTDLYLPALPSMTEYFATSSQIVNMTLVVYFLFMAFGILLWGPLSDKYGRKKIMLAALILYGTACGLCAVARDIWFLILVRACQALGAGGMVAVSTALVKDCFAGKFRDTVLGIVQSLTMLAPMVAPLLGAQLLRFFSWRGTFVFLLLITICTFFIACFFEESLPSSQRNSGNMTQVFGRLIAVGRNINFTYFLLMMAFFNAPYMAYLAVSSYIYVSHFGLTETGYSVMFAINSVFCLAGPLILMRLKKPERNMKIITICYLIAFASGLALLLLGQRSALVFLLCFAPFTAVGTGIRPYSTAILLEQQEGDTGSASSLINFLFTVIGSCGMMIGSLITGDQITGLGIIVVCCSGISLILFFGLLLLRLPVRGLR